MDIVSFTEENMAAYNQTAHGKVYSVHVRINDVNGTAKQMIESIRDTSWISKLNAVSKITFEARAERTIKKLADDIYGKVEDEVTTEFGEYLVSSSAHAALEKKLSHSLVPLTELLKEKVSGNPGFDFHSESPTELISFGEAKYNASSNPYNIAFSQISDFIRDKKDCAELIVLAEFTSENSVSNFMNEKKAYAAAFSIKSQNPSAIIKNALKSKDLKNLLSYPEIYVIGVEIIDK